MPKGLPTKAPYVVFGSMLLIAIVCIAIVVVVHSRRTEPYLDSKMRRVKTRHHAPTPSQSTRTPKLLETKILDAGNRKAAP